MNSRAFILASFVLILLAGCEYWPGYSVSKVDMTGTWRFHDGPITTSYVFRSDGTYTEHIALALNIPQPSDETGTWSAEDSVLHLTSGDGSKNFPLTIKGNSIYFAGDAPHSVFTRQ